MQTVILGGGVAGLSLANFLESESIILEKQDRIGGLCRSYRLNGVDYDIGPHVLFSKNKDVLDFHLSLLETNRLRRSNRILHHRNGEKRFVKYPFENDLASLAAQDRDYCLHEFLNNPYENYDAQNMQQFFLKTFGEGISNLYLLPYNEKIWKFDPSFLDTQMVERIPKPPREDVIKSAKGVETEGYQHQLYFHYPSQGGFQSLVDAYADRVRGKTNIQTSTPVKSISQFGKHWEITTPNSTYRADRLVSTMPVHELFKILQPEEPIPMEVIESVDQMKYLSLYTIVIQTEEDTMGDDFGYYIADPNIAFHRLVKLNFLGDQYKLGGPDSKRSTLLAEITFRPQSFLAKQTEEEILASTLDGLETLNISKRADLIASEVRRFQYAYIIYDLDHRKNTDRVLGYLRSIGIESVGRFAEFEYINSDKVVEKTMALANRLNSQAKPNTSSVFDHADLQV